MAIELSASTATAIAADVTKPVFLVQINFSTILYLSTGRQISWNSQTWVEGSVNVEINGRDAMLTLPNADNAYSAIVYDEGIKDVQIKIWQCYHEMPAADDPVLIYCGNMSAATSVNNANVIISCRPDSSGNLQLPNIVCAPPLMNHLVAAGTKIGTLTLYPRY